MPKSNTSVATLGRRKFHIAHERWLDAYGWLPDSGSNPWMWHVYEILPSGEFDVVGYGDTKREALDDAEQATGLSFAVCR